MTRMTLEQAQDFINAFFAKFSALKKWLEESGNNAVRFGYSTSPKGRKRFYTIPSLETKDADMIISQIRRWAGNQPIQAGNVDMLKPAMSGIYNELRERGISPEDARILFCVHDEIVCTSKIELVEVVKDIMIRNMSRCYEEVVTGIANVIDVATDDVWAKA